MEKEHLAPRALRTGRPTVAAIVTGIAAAFALSGAPLHLHADGGDLVTSFGGAGVVTTDFGGYEDVAYALVRQGNRLVAAGATATGGGNDMGVVRYLSDGRRDPTFGVQGRVTIDFFGSFDDQAAAVDALPGGAIIVGGYAYSAELSEYDPAQFDFALAMLTRDGRLDPSFGSGGLVLTDLGGLDSVGSVTFVSGGRILVTGRTVDVVTDDVQSVLARYNADGSLDASFGAGGWMVTDLPLSRIVVEPGGRIIATSPGPDWTSNMLVRFTAEGMPDPTFGDDGRVTLALPPDAYVAPIALTPDGRIVVSGVVGSDFAVARYTRSGAPDPSFGTGGLVITDVTGGSETSFAVAVLPGGKIVAAGYQYDYPTPRFVAARYDRQGRLDPTFGSDGTVTTTIGTRAEAKAMVALPGGDVVLAGFAELPQTRWDFALVRYEGK